MWKLWWYTGFPRQRETSGVAHWPTFHQREVCLLELVSWSSLQAREKQNCLKATAHKINRHWGGDTERMTLQVRWRARHHYARAHRLTDTHTQAGVRECAPFVTPQYTSYTPSASSYHIYDPLQYHSLPIPKELATGASPRSWLSPVVYTPFCLIARYRFTYLPKLCPLSFGLTLFTWFICVYMSL
jgi:hypothetical protein